MKDSPTNHAKRLTSVCRHRRFFFSKLPDDNDGIVRSVGYTTRNLLLETGICPAILVCILRAYIHFPFFVSIPAPLLIFLSGASPPITLRLPSEYPLNTLDPRYQRWPSKRWPRCKKRSSGRKRPRRARSTKTAGTRGRSIGPS